MEPPPPMPAEEPAPVPAPVHDVENPAETLLLPAGGVATRFATGAHAKTAKFLYDASVTGRLGSGPAERDADRISPIFMIFETIPWGILTGQLAWSAIVVGMGYGLRQTDADGANVFSTLSVEFWTSRLNVSSNIAYGVGWALFVLLGFFIREASARYKEAQFSIDQAMSHARQFLRLVRQMFPPGTWHPGDMDRMAAHLIALPVVLKMTLRGERERQQLEPILDPDDVTDVIEADLMYIQCTRVLRGYTIAIEESSSYSFHHSAADSTVNFEGGRCQLGRLVDAMDYGCNAALRIAHFRPSVGYISHLRNFLYIWSFFLPLVLLRTSGWFTPLWSVIIIYCVGMLFDIAEALNKPYGFDLQDVKLNRICADWAYQLLSEHSVCKFTLKETVLHDHETPQWLEKPIDKPGAEDAKKRAHIHRKVEQAYSGVERNLGSSFVLRNLLLFIAWQSFIVFLSWGLTKDNEVPREPSDRWWSLYLPISTNTTGFISLGVFLLLGFWMNDAYARYWNGLQLWNCTIKPSVQGLSFIGAIFHEKGFWHSRDRERMLSFFVALVYSVKLHLRQSRDLSELEGVLDARDLQELSQAPHLPNYCFTVIYGYFNSADMCDPETTRGSQRQFGADTDTFMLKFKELEAAVAECDATRKYPMSLSFTLHLFVYVTIWLALLAISLVKENGFFTFVFIVPVAYAIINLLNIGVNLSDPFGFDAEDIPMDRICEEIKEDIHAMYHELENELHGFIIEEPYDRVNFTASSVKASSAFSDEEEDDISNEKLKLGSEEPDNDVEMFSPRTMLKGILNQLPTVDPVAQITATVWSVVAVLVSWRLSKLSDEWESGLRGGCHEWCSPIDVDGNTLANIGYALFMLLSFRASDAIGRYEDGAELVYELKLQMHSAAIDFIQCFRQDFMHANDRERIIAHLVQLPLSIRDRLLQGETFNPVTEDTILSPNDQRRLSERRNPIEYIIRVLDSYNTLMKKPSREPFTSEPMVLHTKTIVLLTERFEKVRKTYASMISTKQYPVISRYSNHQYVFTALWLGLLPLYMTKNSGFFTILWAPLISYGVFALQSIAEKLVDPFGEDNIDIPVRKLFTETAEEILTTVEYHNWDCITATKASPVDSPAHIGADIRKGGVGAKRHLPHFEEHEATIENFGKSPIVDFKSSTYTKEKPNFFMHLVRSVPWWALIATVVWTSIGCIISYLSRDMGVTDVRWWKSGISVGSNVARYVSFAAFILLGFYVQAAFRRYTQAGTVWGDNLRASCHTCAVLSINLFPVGGIHEKDVDRILAHITAIPLVLKVELRGSRDLRELRGLLSFEDIARIQAAYNMTTHCVDVLRAYMHTIMNHQDRMEKKPEPLGKRVTMLNIEVQALRQAVRCATFLTEFDIAPGFIILLQTLLAIWFVFLPFVLAEISGWFSILWVAIIAYGVLGMYWVAAELQSPFGLDVNDLDLDKIADEIVADLLFVQKNYKAGIKVLTAPFQPTGLWNPDTTFEKKRPSHYIEKPQSFAQRVKEGIYLALKTASPFRMGFSVLWATVCVLFAYGTSKWFPLEDGVCSSLWFCTYIAVDGSLNAFIGFALFLLLGFRLYDSHDRFVMAVRLWQDQLLGLTRLLTDRILCAVTPGLHHEDDLQRICGHLAAFSICAMGALRGEDYEEKLARVVSREDVERILSATDRIDYCMDVVHGYAMQGDWMRARKPGSEPAGSFETTRIILIIRDLAQSAYECRRLVRTPLPFGYVQHLKIFLYIWLLLLPLSLVEKTGWLTILWVVIIAYGVFGVEHWSNELADPFGHDVSDVPLDEMCDRIVGEIKDAHALLSGGGIGAWMHPNRSGLNSAAKSCSIDGI